MPGASCSKGQPDEMTAHLLGLANLAASHRLPELAVAVRQLTRLARQQGSIDLARALQLLTHSAAAHAEEAEWRRFVGTSFHDLALSLGSAQEAGTLLNWTDGLCEIDSLLRSATGRARARARLRE